MNKIYCVGVGPGDPELLTLKAHKLISNASQSSISERETPREELEQLLKRHFRRKMSMNIQWNIR